MEYKWKAFSVTSIGALMSAIDSTIVMLALLPIAKDLHTDYVIMVWVIIAYLLTNTALVLSLGRLADMFGRKRMYNIGFIIFTIGSALCGLAGTGLTLIIYRVIQGMGAALLIANSFAILSEAFPPQERGKAFGMNAIVWGIGSVLGIILGGVIVSYTSWRLIFLINIPIGIFGTVWAYRTLHEVLPSQDSAKRKQSFDIPAALAFTTGLVLLQMGVTWGLLHSWTSPVAITLLALTPFPLLFFVIWELKYSKNPIIDLSLFFRNRLFSVSIAAALLQSLALFSANFLLIFYFEGVYGISVLRASFLLVPMAVSSAIVGPFAGRLSDRIGARKVASAGLAVQAVVLILLSRLGVSTSLWYVGVIEMFYGVGGGLFWPANTSAIMSAAPRGTYGAASGIMNTFRNTGMILSFALALTAATSKISSQLVGQLFLGSYVGSLPLSTAIGYLSGQRFAFEISAAVIVVAVVLSLLGGTAVLQKAREPQVGMAESTTLNIKSKN